MRKTEFDLEHKVGGKVEAYWVMVEYSRTWVDDSFDHDWGGRRQTEICGHFEVDPDDWSIISCTDGDGEEVDVGLVPGLEDAIAETLLNLDVDD
jgi:hypothetical protein